MGFLEQIGSSIASGLGSSIGGLITSPINYLFGNLSQDRQVSKSKELMDYQWNHFQSPKAQVESMASAGLNPAGVFGGHGSFASPQAAMPTSTPVQIDGVSDMLSSLTQLKKVDKDNELVDQEIYKTLAEKNLIDEQRHGQAIANTILHEYGDKEAAARVANLGGQTALYSAEKDLAKANESLTDLKKETEKIYQGLVKQNKLKAALEVKNYQRYIDSVVESNRASARQSETQADLNVSNKSYQDIVNDIKESGKTFELENLIRSWQSENKVSDATAEQAYTMLARYRQLNENDRNAGAKYLNYMFWFFKEQMPDLPIVPFLNIGKK